MKLATLASLLFAATLLLVFEGGAAGRACPPGYHFFRGRCAPNAACPVGYHRNPAGVCVRHVAACPVGYHRNPAGVCVRHAQACPPGYYRNYRGFCVRR